MIKYIYVKSIMNTAEKVEQKHPNTLFEYYSSKCERFYDSRIFLYHEHYLYTGESFYSLEKVVAMYINTKGELTPTLVILYDDSQFLKTLRLTMTDEAYGYSIYDLYSWLHEKLLDKQKNK